MTVSFDNDPAAALPYLFTPQEQRRLGFLRWRYDRGQLNDDRWPIARTRALAVPWVARLMLRVREEAPEVIQEC